MKRAVVFLVVFAHLFMMLTSCNITNNGDDEMKNVFNEYATDDMQSLDDGLSKSYSLSELLSFFKTRDINKASNKENDANSLLFSEVNARYPVEVFRSNGYCVYKVEEGGYFYVFWVMSINNTSPQQISEPAVYFSAYIPSNKSISDFEALQIGHNTAKDIEAIDPYFELCLLMSNGIFSYSFLNGETILQVEYDLNGEYDGCESLTIKSITTVPRQNSSSKYSIILEKDLP